MAEYIDKWSVVNKLIDLENEFQQYKPFHGFEHAMYRKVCEAEIAIGKTPAADVVEVVHDYHIGDVCIYGYGAENKSRAIVEIVKILNDERGVAEVKFHKVFVDDTGNGLFNYLLRSGKTMNASFRYLNNITPRMDGE